ncbi:DegT/DnrJ/EryC1/StrS aminotransferase family protein [Flavihumibacter sp. ZG627]|uniref:DegT/DnrJ/EryC1/StrS family aminotransferase n=1 Tax=Flavihumibacter sp. ZG627 TaxID=1463156 RepID=UPI00057F236E|nr:DegT/DnrJ/EryC1/StrS family aminotransferase [Flavihumibacter sp. ZG627]KIC92332.1 aminotransferase DegT [Flavihumibacter sp. ZG627]
MQELINVTRTHLPPLEEYVARLEEIWSRNWVTNYGPVVQELEEKLKQYFGVKHLFYVGNGTIALQIAIKAAGLKDEIITTPFSYVATTSAIVWENCIPVYADIEANSLCIDPAKLRSKISARTSAILATHVYGNPCDTHAIEKVAKEHNLKVIYDAAHSYGVEYEGKSLLQYGDISTISFHATKLFHTIEGGAIITNDDALAEKISLMMNFGHSAPTQFDELGINGKNSEIHAAIGLCMMDRIPMLIEKRKLIFAIYDSIINWEQLRKPVIRENTLYNYSYYPVIFKDEQSLLKVQEALGAENIFPRRYFYPSLTKLPYVTEQQAPVAEDIANRVLCLPLYPELDRENISRICRIINNNC